MKNFLPLAVLLALGVFFADLAHAAQKPLGVLIYNRYSLDIDDAKRTATLSGLGTAKLESEDAPKGTLINVVFRKTEEPLLQPCKMVLSHALPDNYQLRIWGYGTSATSYDATGARAVTVTLGAITECMLVPNDSASLAQPPTPYPQTPGIDLPELPDVSSGPISNDFMMVNLPASVDRAYGDDELSGSDEKFLNDMLVVPETGVPAEDMQKMIGTLLPDMARRIHRIVTDEKADKEGKKAAIRLLLTAPLSPQDLDTLSGMKHNEKIIGSLPPIDRAKLHFLLTDSLVRNRAADVDSFIRSAQEREEQEKRAHPPTVPELHCLLGSDGGEPGMKPCFN
jgi:hypothetical protein